jgi:hypothetical protein
MYTIVRVSGAETRDTQEGAAQSDDLVFTVRGRNGTVRCEFASRDEIISEALQVYEKHVGSLEKTLSLPPHLAQQYRQNPSSLHYPLRYLIAQRLFNTCDEGPGVYIAAVLEGITDAAIEEDVAQFAVRLEGLASVEERMAAGYGFIEQPMFHDPRYPVRSPRSAYWCAELPEKQREALLGLHTVRLWDRRI